MNIDTGFDLDDDGFERRLAALPVPPMPAGLAARCRGLIAAGAKPDSAGRRRSSRLVLLGTAVVVAAAAAMLVRQFGAGPVQAPRVPAPNPVQLPQGAEVAQDPPAAPEVELSAVAAPKAAPAAAADVPAPFTVRVLPLRNEARNAVAHSGIEMFHAAFLGGLREVPGLTLITPESTGVAEGMVAPYQLEFRGSDATSPGKWNLRIDAQAMVAGASTRSLMTVPIIIQGGDGDPASMAAAQVDLVRSMLFPQDAGRKRQLQSRLLDRTLDPSARLRALTDLRQPRLIAPENGRPGRIQNSPLDEAMIQGAVELTTVPDAKVRASVWRALRGAGNPALVGPLVQSARHDDSDEVRLLAVAMLAQEYPAEPVATAALQAAVIDDPRQLVRMVAQKSIAGGAAGDALWRDYVLTTLRDQNLDARQRLEPLSYMAGPGRQSMAGLVNDEMLGSLAPLVPAVWSGDTDLAILGRALMDVQSSTPFVVDLCVEALRASVNPAYRSAAVSTLAARYSNDERARKALEAVAANDPDPAQREKAADALRRAPDAPQ